MSRTFHHGLRVFAQENNPYTGLHRILTHPRKRQRVRYERPRRHQANELVRLELCELIDPFRHTHWRDCH